MKHVSGPVTRRLMAVAAASAVTAGSISAVVVPPAAASTKKGTVMVKTQRMSAATLKSKQSGWYGKGSKLTLTCYARGQSVTGYYSKYIRGGWDNLWYKVSDNHWVADVDIYTGSNNPVTPACSKPKPPKPSLNASVDAFVKKWLGKTADFDGRYGGQCVDLFNYYNRDVVHAKFAPGDNAYQIYDSYDHGKYTRVSAGSTPKKGDVAVYASSLPNSRGAGHVAIVLGTSGKNIVVLNQNYLYVQHVTKNTLSKSYLRGFLRPKV